MARINLLPWRAERRAVRQREFAMMLGAAAVAAVLAVGGVWYWMNLRIENQADRISYLQEQIKDVEKKLTEIKELDKTRSKLLQRKQVIEQLQANRSQMVHMFDELVRTIPDGVRLTSLKQVGDVLTLEGVAQSNASVATYMRNVEASPWLGHPDLKKTEIKRTSEKRMPYDFAMDVKLRKPASAEGEEGQGGDAAGAPPGAAAPTAAAPAAVPATPAPDAQGAKK
ncbi:type IV pilus assembly protein PilN [Tahibacter aquaticus]|uniref:Type IV pilus assembly protein PilN n=1 Tax=Tahibacter aquaticus TaxID=520092 RepID=A0A4R6YTH9_9GAMM|nr:PilN domain-containing protein [Tahibacter aquaticus]TDR41707.1 type IV pilus assembly protein PilN [Tahibacter aquaticus]